MGRGAGGGGRSGGGGKLYHVSPGANTNSILNDGIYSTPTEGGKLTDPSRDTLQNQELYGVYVFTSQKDAVSFAQDNNWDTYTVFEVSPPKGADILIDPEYDGESKFIVTDSNLPVVKIVKQKK